MGISLTSTIRRGRFLRLTPCLPRPRPITLGFPIITTIGEGIDTRPVTVLGWEEEIGMRLSTDHMALMTEWLRMITTLEEAYIVIAWSPITVEGGPTVETEGVGMTMIEVGVTDESCMLQSKI